MEGASPKRWFHSKTLWTNLIAAVSVYTAKQYGFEIDPVMTAYIIAGINWALRIITKQPLSL